MLPIEYLWFDCLAREEMIMRAIKSDVYHGSISKGAGLLCPAGIISQLLN
jgi:hypothetical protein